jgi:hypothetical protein
MPGWNCQPNQTGRKRHRVPIPSINALVVLAQLAFNAQFRDTAAMPYTDAERQRLRRARLKAGEVVPSCTACGARLQLDRRERPDRQGDDHCWTCWLRTPAGRDYIRERRRLARAADPDKIREQTRASVRRARAKTRGIISSSSGVDS